MQVSTGRSVTCFHSKMWKEWTSLLLISPPVRWRWGIARNSILKRRQATASWSRLVITIAKKLPVIISLPSLTEHLQLSIVLLVHTVGSLSDLERVYITYGISFSTSSMNSDRLNCFQAVGRQWQFTDTYKRNLRFTFWIFDNGIKWNSFARFFNNLGLAAQGQEVTSIEGYDKDSNGPNKWLTFTLHGQNRLGDSTLEKCVQPFRMETVNNSTGKLVVVVSDMLNCTGSYDIIVQVNSLTRRTFF